jgi:putative transposase
MQFEQGHIYHIYNQGNNRQQIFFERDNYLFFLKKIKEFVCPYADVIAWCLMPNHFHLMLEVKDLSQTIKPTHGVTLSHPVSEKQRSFNDSIAIMLRSYTRAINKQQNRSGNLFREATKAECISKSDGITSSFYNTQYGTIINTHNTKTEYPQVCFDYIHQNPLRTGLVRNAEDWEFSSYRDYCGMRNGSLINRRCGAKYGINVEAWQ